MVLLSPEVEEEACCLLLATTTKKSVAENIGKWRRNRGKFPPTAPLSRERGKERIRQVGDQKLDPKREEEVFKRSLLVPTVFASLPSKFPNPAQSLQAHAKNFSSEQQVS